MPGSIRQSGSPKCNLDGISVNSFSQFLTSDNAMGMLSIIVVIGLPIVCVCWYKLRVKQWEMSLKHTMLERGMSADEIKTVLAASAKDYTGKGCWGK